MGQKPITFIRQVCNFQWFKLCVAYLQDQNNYVMIYIISWQVLSLVSYPPGINASTFPEDVKQKARTILEGCRGGSVGMQFCFL